MQDGCQILRPQGADLLEIAKRRATRFASTRNTVPPRYTQNSTRKRQAISAPLPRHVRILRAFVCLPHRLSGYRYKLVRTPNAQNLRSPQAISLAHIETGWMCILRISSRDKGRHSSPSAVRGPRCCRPSGKSARSMKSPPAVMLALDITFSSSRTFPGQACYSSTACARRVNPKIVFPYASLYFLRKNCTSSGMSSSRSVSEGRRIWMELRR